MKIEILGTRGEIDSSAPRHRRHSGILIDGQLLLDLGEREFLSRRPRWICITHLHPDHAAFILKSFAHDAPHHAQIHLAGPLYHYTHPDPPQHQG